ncbi:MAG: beta-glucuronidase, partial [Bacteroidales bacterium]
MKIKLFISLIFSLIFFISENLPAQSPLITGTYSRKTKSLNGKWHYIIDPYETGYYNYRYQPYDQIGGSGGYYNNLKQKDKSDLIEYNFDKSPVLSVPGDWNTQDPKLLYYEGTIWYKKSFDYKKNNESYRVFIYFGAVNYQADVYLNGMKLGTHIGGFTPFNFEITGKIQEADNFVVVKVDNKRKREGVPTLNTDWWNYGGITRDVKIIEVPSTFIRDYCIQLKKNNRDVLAGYVQLDGKNAKNIKVEMQIPEAGIKHIAETDEKGNAEIEIKTDNMILWSPENPKLYDVTVKTETDIV